MTNKNVKGSAILVVILISAVLLSSLLVMWRTVSYSHEAALNHYQAIRHTYRAEGLLTYGLSLLKEQQLNLDLIKKVDQTMLIYDGSWPINSTKDSGALGQLQIKRLAGKNQFLLSASLIDLKQSDQLVKVEAVCEWQSNKITILSWKK